MKKTIILLFCFFCTVSTAQEVRYGIHCGYGTYRMADLKEFQSDLVIETIHVKETERFPGYINYVANFAYCLDKHLLGINAGYYTTGGRNHVSDYSGEYSLDMPLNAFRLGIQYRYLYPLSERLSLTNSLSGGIIITTLKIRESLVIYNMDNVATSYKFRSNGIFFEPSIGLSYVLWKKLNLEYSIGYQVDMESKLHLLEENEAYLRNESGDPVKADWSGIRLLIGISIEI